MLWRQKLTENSSVREQLYRGLVRIVLGSFVKGAQVSKQITKIFRWFS